MGKLLPTSRAGVSKIPAGLTVLGNVHITETFNRASKSEILDGLRRSDSTDIVAIFGDANPRGFETNEMLGRGFITKKEIGKALGADGNPAGVCLMMGCSSQEIAREATRASGTTAIGTMTDVNTTGLFGAMKKLIERLPAEGPTAKLISDSEEGNFSNDVLFVIYRPER